MPDPGDELRRPPTAAALLAAVGNPLARSGVGSKPSTASRFGEPPGHGGRERSVGRDEGLAAFRRGEWAEARRHIEPLLDADPDPELLDALATACRFIGDLDDSLAFRERAYRLFRERGAIDRAAVAAAWLGRDAAMPRGELNIARAWFTTARRLLGECDSAEAQATVLYFEGQFALLGELDAARGGELGAQARQIARELGDLDLEMQGLSLEGLAKVAVGEVEAGMALVEEAASAVLADELSGPDVAGWICCHLIYACERTTDTRRAAEWCRAMRRFCEQWEMPGMFGMCRSHYGSVLVAEGRWDDAEQEFAEASRLFREAAPGLAYEAIVRLCDLRFRQGRLAESAKLARVLVDRQLGWLVMPYLAGISLYKGDLDDAQSMLDRYFALVPDRDRLVQVMALDVASQLHLAREDAEAARVAATELEAMSSGTEPGRLAAIASLARGRARMIEGALDAAALDFERAASIAAAAEIPYERARAQAALGALLADQGATDEASLHLDHAVRTFRELGAAAELASAEVKRAALGAAGGPGPGQVTERERDVLRLAAEGRTDAQIADALGLSPHTVHRHVANLRTKLGADSKAALVANALRDGLI